MDQSQKLVRKFKEILGSNNVYYQIPSSEKMNYPAIKFSRNNIKTISANNKPYLNITRYTVTLMDRDPDSVFISAILELSGCKHDRHYVVNGLHHDTFTITLQGGSK